MTATNLTAHSSVASAAFRALAAWLIIYAVLSQLLVIPKWILEEQDVEIVVETPDDVAAPNEDDIREQERRIQLVHRLVEDAKEVETRHKQVVASHGPAFGAFAEPSHEAAIQRRKAAGAWTGFSQFEVLSRAHDAVHTVQYRRE